MLKNSCNKKVPGKFKDECASKCITEFIGLRSKMYSFMLDDKKDVTKAEIRVAKGVQKSVIFNDLRFSTLCPFEDKGYVLDAINSLPYSHYVLGC